MRASLRRGFQDLRDDLRRLPPKDLALGTVRRIGADEVTTLSTSFAYFWVFAIPPILVLLVMSGVMLDKATNVPVVDNLRTLIQDHAPGNTQDLLLNMVDNAVAKVAGNVASVSALFTAALALWSASSSISILILGFNRAYDVTETRPYVRRKLLTIALTLLVVVSINLAFALLLFGQRLGDWIANRYGFGAGFSALWAFIRWPMTIGGIMLVLSVLYWAGPNVKQPFRWVSPGSLTTTMLWLALVGLFGIYLSISNPASAYGVVGSVIVLLIFLNFTGIIFFLGAEINAVLYRAAIEAAHPAPHRGHEPLPALADG